MQHVTLCGLAWTLCVSEMDTLWYFTEREISLKGAILDCQGNFSLGVHVSAIGLTMAMHRPTMLIAMSANAYFGSVT